MAGQGWRLLSTQLQPQPLLPELLTTGDAAAGIGATLSSQWPAPLRLRVPGASGLVDAQGRYRCTPGHVGPPSCLPACLPAKVRGLAGKRFEAHFVCVVGAVRAPLFTQPQPQPSPSPSPSPSPRPSPSPSPSPNPRPCQARDTLFTLNARVPEARWPEARAGLLAAAASFELLE